MSRARKYLLLWLLLMVGHMDCDDDNIRVEPAFPVTYYGGSINLVCVPVTAGDDAEWLVNREILDRNRSGITIFPQSRLFSINFGNWTENNTAVQCRNAMGISQPVFLRLVDSLGAVRSLKLTIEAGSAILTWTPPNTLVANPDIVYCVGVVSSISSTTPLCGITVTNFTYLLSWCDVYTFIVTPMVGGVIGTSSSQNYSQEILPKVKEVRYTKEEEVTVVMVAPVCHAQLTLVDVDTKEEIILENSNLTIAETNITFTVGQLRDNRRYSGTVVANNTAGMAVSNMTSISTHGIRNVTVTREDVIKTDYFKHSNNTSGALIMFYHEATADSTSFALERNASVNYNMLPCSVGDAGNVTGNVTMLAYDIESDGTLASGVGYPAVNRKVATFPDCQPSYQFLKRCMTGDMSGRIVVECAFPGGSTAIGFQVIASQQLNNSSRIGEIYVCKTTDRQTPACSVLVEENGPYEVTVFPISGGSGILDNQVEYKGHVIVNSIVSTAVDPTTESPSNKISVPGVVVGVVVVLGVGILGAVVAVLKLVHSKKKVPGTPEVSGSTPEVKQALVLPVATNIPLSKQASTVDEDKKEFEYGQKPQTLPGEDKEEHKADEEAAQTDVQAERTCQRAQKRPPAVALMRGHDGRPSELGCVIGAGDPRSHQSSASLDMRGDNLQDEASGHQIATTTPKSADTPSKPPITPSKPPITPSTMTPPQQVA